MIGILIVIATCIGVVYVIRDNERTTAARNRQLNSSVGVTTHQKNDIDTIVVKTARKHSMGKGGKA